VYVLSGEISISAGAIEVVEVIDLDAKTVETLTGAGL
jgi:hypothetical protein